MIDGLSDPLTDLTSAITIMRGALPSTSTARHSKEPENNALNLARKACVTSQSMSLPSRILSARSNALLTNAVKGGRWTLSIVRCPRWEASLISIIDHLSSSLRPSTENGTRCTKCPDKISDSGLSSVSSLLIARLRCI
ncbi:hypothetical protein V5799_023607 [Amblyomma americanum]|uniref:Uncharacterized protein n=1 Tax=Amblyomma americanum TaxID=6943 RepID=A0AAQ4FH10_AMBAM